MSGSTQGELPKLTEHYETRLRHYGWYANAYDDGTTEFYAVSLETLGTIVLRSAPYIRLYQTTYAKHPVDIAGLLITERGNRDYIIPALIADVPPYYPCFVRPLAR